MYSLNKIIETVQNVIDSHQTNFMNKELGNNEFSENAKTALARPSYRKLIDTKFKIIDL